MKRVLMLVVLALVAVGGAFSQAQTGQWLADCWKASRTDARAAGLFEGFIAGCASVDGHIFFSTPDTVTLEQQAQVVGAWLDDHPNDLAHAADEIVDKALAGHWPSEGNGLRPRISAAS